MVIATPLLCLTMAIYFEARSEPEYGQILVANTIENRVRSNSYPNNYCDVVTQNKQFSFFNDASESNELKVRDMKTWNKIKTLAENYLDDLYLEMEYSGCHYHNNTVNPRWAKKLKPSKVVGHHKFYEGGC